MEVVDRETEEVEVNKVSEEEKNQEKKMRGGMMGELKEKATLHSWEGQFPDLDLSLLLGL